MVVDWPLVTIIAASIATVVNLTVAFAEGWWKHLFLSRYYRVIWFTVAAFAAFYAVAFAVLRIGEVDQGEWSRFMVRFSALSFITVWTAPAALRGYKLWMARRLKEKVL